MGRSRKRKTPDRTWIKQVAIGVLTGTIVSIISEIIEYVKTLL